MTSWSYYIYQFASHFRIVYSHYCIFGRVIAKEIDVAIPANGFVYDGTLDGLRIVYRICAANFLESLFVMSFLLDIDVNAHPVGLLLHKFLYNNRMAVYPNYGTSDHYRMFGIGDISKEGCFERFSIINQVRRGVRICLMRSHFIPYGSISSQSAFVHCLAHWLANVDIIIHPHVCFAFTVAMQTAGILRDETFIRNWLGKEQSVKAR